MKKLFQKSMRAVAMLLVVVLFVSTFAVQAEAAAKKQKVYKSGNWKYTITNGNITLTEYTGKETAVKIPDTINGKKVVAMGSQMFYFNKTIEKITFNKYITSTGYDSFVYCTNLKTIVWGKKITVIDAISFQGCEKITNLTIPNTVKKIESLAFCYNDKLKTVKLSKNLEELTYGAFAECTGLTSLEIPSKVKNVGSEFCRNCTSLKKVTFTNPTTVIPETAFKGCNKKKLVIYGKSGSTAQKFAKQHKFKFKAIK